jgi:hypothetical protein
LFTGPGQGGWRGNDSEAHPHPTMNPYLTELLAREH